MSTVLNAKLVHISCIKFTTGSPLGATRYYPAFAFRQLPESRIRTSTALPKASLRLFELHTFGSLSVPLHHEICCALVVVCSLVIHTPTGPHIVVTRAQHVSAPRKMPDEGVIKRTYSAPSALVADEQSSLHHRLPRSGKWGAVLMLFKAIVGAVSSASQRNLDRAATAGKGLATLKPPP